jgi:hypothetical protein
MRCTLCEWEDESTDAGPILQHVAEVHGLDGRARLTRDEDEDQAAPIVLRSA